MPLNAHKCSGCGLVFERMQNVTNRAGKKYLREKKYKSVVYDTNLPKDIVKWELLLIAIFLGWSGAHYAKVGRYKMFSFMLLSFLAIMTYTILTFSKIIPAVPIGQMNFYGILAFVCIIPGSVAFIFWMVSIWQIVFKGFKVPVGIDAELVAQDYDKRVVKEVVSTIEEDKLVEKNNKKKTKKGKHKKQNFYKK